MRASGKQQRTESRHKVVVDTAQEPTHRNYIPAVSSILNMHRVVGNQAVRTWLQRSESSSGTPEERGAVMPEHVDQALRSPGRPLDPGIRSGMRTHFADDFRNVRIHADSAAARSASALHARAYTLGSNIVFGANEYAPDSRTGRLLLAHELAHVLQQRSSTNAGSQQSPGVGSPSGRAERAADSAARSVARGGPVSRSSALQLRNNLRATSLAQPAIQRAVKTWGGEFIDDTYALTKNKGMDGVDMVLRFKPNKYVDAELIGMTQTARSRVGGKPVPTSMFGKAADVTLKARTIPAGGAGSGTRIDRISTHGNPLYAAGKPGAKDTLPDTATVAGWGRHGWRFTDKAKKLQTQDALLKDTPQMPSALKETQQVFETTALAVKGTQSGTFYGSVQWGWEKSAAGTVSKLPLTLVSADVPSAVFASATELWNKGTTSGGTATIDLPVVVKRYITTPNVWLVSNPSKYKSTLIGKLDKNTGLEVIDKGAAQPFNAPTETWWKVTVVDGTHIGKVGWLMHSFLADAKVK